MQREIELAQAPCHAPLAQHGADDGLLSFCGIVVFHGAILSARLRRLHNLGGHISAQGPVVAADREERDHPFHNPPKRRRHHAETKAGGIATGGAAREGKPAGAVQRLGRGQREGGCGRRRAGDRHQQLGARGRARLRRRRGDPAGAGGAGRRSHRAIGRAAGLAAMAAVEAGARAALDQPASPGAAPCYTGAVMSPCIV